MTERKKATKAIILARVSSKEQEEGYSIDAQTYRLQEYCLRKGLEVLQIFRFSESSTIGNREKFLQAINFAKQQKEIIAVVADKVDRLQRSYKETPLLNDLIEKEKIELHFYTENCIIHKHSTSQERMMWNIFVMMAQNYVDSLKDNINRSIAQKLRQGECISTAPIGYLHAKCDVSNQKGKSNIIVDEIRAPLIKKMFEMYATGAYTIREILENTREWELRNSRGNQSYLCLSQVHDILQNPFYYGVMRVLKSNKTYHHIYPPIITKELFDRCQDIRLGKKRNPFKWTGKDYIFRGLIKCANTDRVVTADIKRKTYINGNVGSWTYLHLWSHEHTNRAIFVKEEKILKEVEKVFESMHLDSEMLKKVIGYIKNSSDTEQEYHKTRIKELHTEHTKLLTRMDRLTNLFLDGDIDKKTHEEKREEFIKRREEIMAELESSNKSDDNFSKTLVTLVQLASRAAETFKGSTTSEKRELINLVFANLRLDAQKLHYSLRSPFDMFVKLPENGEWWR